MMRIAIAALLFAASIGGNASAETFRFPAAQVNLGVSQVDIAMAVIMHPDCAGRWSVDYPAGFSFKRGGPDGGNLHGNPGRGSYDIAVTTDACPSRTSNYIEPARTIWHRVVVY
jgi:hypothetical protein